MAKSLGIAEVAGYPGEACVKHEDAKARNALGLMLGTGVSDDLQEA